jgi:hypothetical protein
MVLSAFESKDTALRISPLLCVTALLAAFGTTQAHAATLPARQPGLWLSSTIVTLADGSKYRGGNPVITVSCVDPATDLKFFTYSGSSCTALKVAGTGQQFNITGNCQGQTGTEKIATSLTYLDQSTVELIGTVGTASGVIHLNGELKFQGPCLPGMVPGDEGDIENGQFVKADNVNDPAAP